MSDEEYGFEPVVLDKGKGKQQSTEIEYTSMSPQDLENAMKKEAEYVSGIFGADVSTLSTSI